MSRPKLTKSNICALVVTYFPDAVFSEYLESIRQQCNLVCIVDNSSHGKPLEMLERLRSDAVHILTMGRNVGLGAALNEGVEYVKKLGYRWVILFDQDSQPKGDMVANFANIIAENPRSERIALIGSRFLDRNRLSAALSASSLPAERSLWIEKRRVITSGMLLAMDAFEDIGSFREEFFIDTIDHEYCYRAQRRGWRVLQATQPLLIHSVGNYRPHSFLGQTVWRSHHSALRCYFMTRNPMILAREEGAYFKLVRGAYNALANVFFILLFEADKAKKIQATLFGYFHGVMCTTSIPMWIRHQADGISVGAHKCCVDDVATP